MLSAVANARSTASGVRPSGFSQRTCLPASSALIDQARGVRSAARRRPPRRRRRRAVPRSFRRALRSAVARAIGSAHGRGRGSRRRSLRPCRSRERGTMTAWLMRAVERIPQRTGPSAHHLRSVTWSSQQVAPGLWRWTAGHPEWEAPRRVDSPADWPPGGRLCRVRPRRHARRSSIRRGSRRRVTPRSDTLAKDKQDVAVLVHHDFTSAAATEVKRRYGASAPCRRA